MIRSRTTPHARPFLLLAGLFGLLALTPAPSSAQMTRADSAAVLLQTARDFEADGDYETADALLYYLTERFAGTPSGDIAADLLRGPTGDRAEPVSRVELPVFSTTYGLWLGIGIPWALGADDPEAYGAGLLVGGPLGLFSGLAYSRSRRLSAGQARAISWGGLYGSWQGWGWTQLFDLGIEERCESFGCFPNEGNSEELAAGAVIGGLLGIGTGALLARNPIRSGVASGAQGGSIWGTIYGAMLAGIFDDDGDDSTLATALVAGNVGLLAGGALAGKHNVGRDRIRLMNLGALVGGLGGLGIDLLIQPDDTETAIAIPLAASVAGLVIAARNTRDRPAPADGGAGPAMGQGTALLGWQDGSLRIQAPMPVPTLLPMDDPNGRTAWRPGLRLELFRSLLR